MATSKKKKSAKRVVKTASKAAIKPAVKAAQANQAAWTQQSAKLLPFAQSFGQGDMGEVTKQAENMMRMGSDAMQQWWTAAQSAATNPQDVASQTKKQVNDLFANVPSFKGMPNFDPSKAQEQLSGFARDSAEQLSKSAGSCSKAMNEAMAISKESATTLAEVSNIAVALTKELSAEMISFCNKSFSQNVELSKQVLACRTLNDMFDLSSKFMKTNLDSFFSESVKLSELLFQASTDVTEPLNERISESSERISKALAA